MSLLQNPWSMIAFYMAILALMIPIFFGFVASVAQEASEAATSATKGPAQHPQLDLEIRSHRKMLIRYSLFCGKFLHCFSIYSFFQIVKLVSIADSSSALVAALSVNLAYFLYMSAYIAHEWEVTFVPRFYPQILVVLFVAIPMIGLGPRIKAQDVDGDLIWSFGISLIYMFIWLGFIPVAFQPITRMLRLKGLAR